VTILQIAVLSVLAAGIGQLRRGRELGMLAISALAVFWLQPALGGSTLQYWLPVATLGMVVLSWALTSGPGARSLRRNWPAFAVLALVILFVELSRYTGLQAVFGALTPRLSLVVGALAGVAALTFLLLRWERSQRLWRWVALAVIILIFIVLKTPGLAARLLGYLGSLRGVPQGGESAALSWLGFSYLAFRLMHTIRDRQSGRLPATTLSEYANYAIFFPAFTAGPIDRLERFLKDFCAPAPLSSADWTEAGTRLFLGLFKKFVIADLLVVISINDTFVLQARSAGWLWLFLYAYALRIYFDFSGYTDIAIGMGRLMGIRLPENFSAPYLKPNLTQFWNSWHMTLTQWFRSYWFNPMARAMRSASRPLPAWLMVLVAQLSTMVLIGLWHGVTLGFVTWGLWHGAGLFIHNRWSDLLKSRVPAWLQTARGQQLSSAAGVFLTFNFVAIGWLFFTLSSPAIAWLAIVKLFKFI
jgi:D-alanyl-lipoteichoic acid acyltransferase DltB (MBOAT superfamily)